MERHSFAFRIKKGKLADFLKDYGNKWNSIRSNIKDFKVSNYSLWSCDNYFFGYYESNEKKPVTKEILSPVLLSINELSDFKSDFENNMNLMYEDFGIVRTDKSMIRHRVFMTHLLNGDTKEYKRRHDELANARTSVNKGPDSNFSIWNSGDYIFGYDEIDTSMEHEMTESEKKDTIKWEKNMLDIMEWITDDVDFITDMHHSHVKRVAYEE